MSEPFPVTRNFTDVVVWQRAHACSLTRDLDEISRMLDGYIRAMLSRRTLA